MILLMKKLLKYKKSQIMILKKILLKNLQIMEQIKLLMLLKYALNYLAITKMLIKIMT